MDEELKERLQQKSTWIRALYMLLFAIIFGLLEIIIAATVVIQFVLTLLTGKRNEQLINLGQSLSSYLYQVTLFLTFVSDDHPYPFSDWPQSATDIKAAPKKRAKSSKTKSAPKKSKTSKESASEENKNEQMH